MATEEWVELDLRGDFRVQIPADAQASLQEEGGTAVIRLGPPTEATEVLIANFPLGKSANDCTEHAVALRDVVVDFFMGAARKALGHELKFNVEVTEETDRNLYYGQGVGLIDKERVWLARAYARRGEDRYWFVHWNGPKTMTELVLRIFVTFDPAE